MAEENEAGGGTWAEVSLLPLYLERDTLAFYMEMHKDDQKDINLTEACLKYAFTNGVFTTYRKLSRWAGKRVDVYINRIRQLAGMAEFEGIELERLSWPLSQGFLMLTTFNANSLATGIVVESNGASIENVSSLCLVCESKYINLAELDAILKCVNMLLQLWTDSSCVYHMERKRTYKTSVCLVCKKNWIPFGFEPFINPVYILV